MRWEGGFKKKILAQCSQRAASFHAAVQVGAEWWGWTEHINREERLSAATEPKTAGLALAHALNTALRSQAPGSVMEFLVVPCFAKHVNSVRGREAACSIFPHSVSQAGAFLFHHMIPRPLHSASSVAAS